MRKISAVTDRLEATQANLCRSTFNDVDLSDASFRNVRLSSVQFEDVDLTNTKLTNVNLSGVVIEDANLAGMKINGILVEDLLAAYNAQRG